MKVSWWGVSIFPYSKAMRISVKGMNSTNFGIDFFLSPDQIQH